MIEMQETQPAARLSERGFWDKRHADFATTGADQVAIRTGGLHGLFVRARTRIGAEPEQAYADYLVSRAIKSILPTNPNWTALEVGCAPGHNLVLLNRFFRYQPWGVEYSPVGAEATRATFQRHGFDPRHVIEADYFSDAFQSGYRGYFDVVFSGGFIEHFSDPAAVVTSHASLVKPGGYLVCTIPNLRSYSYPFLRLFAPDILAAHNLGIMRLKPFRSLFDNRLLHTQLCRYVGICQVFGVALRHERSLRGAVARVLDRGADLMNHAMFLLLRGAALETPWSPHLIYVGQRRG